MGQPVVGPDLSYRDGRSIAKDPGHKGEVEVVRVAGPGLRDRTLNRAAFDLGQLVGSGSLGRSEVEAALRDAGLASGLHELEVELTLRSGLEAGLESPRTPPAKDDGRRS